MRELIDRIGFANAIVGVITAFVAVLIIGAGLDFDANEMIEVIVTIGLVAVALGAFAFLPHIVGLILDSLNVDVE
jgi:hypothetical protein